MSDYKQTRDESSSVALGGLGVVHRLAGADTRGSFTVVEHPMQPHVLGSPIHTHTREDEYSFILEGQVTVMIGEAIFTAGPGDWVCKPRGIPHAFWNAQETPALILEIIAPPGFEKYFDEMAKVAAAGPPIDFARITEIQHKYGLESDPASMQALCQKYNLHL